MTVMLVSWLALWWEGICYNHTVNVLCLTNLPCSALHFQFPMHLCSWILRTALQPGRKWVWIFALPPWRRVHRQARGLCMHLPCWLFRYSTSPTAIPKTQNQWEKLGLIASTWTARSPRLDSFSVDGTHK